MVNPRSNKHMVAIVALICIFVVAPMIGMHDGWALIPLAAIAAVFALLWQLLSVRTRRMEQQAPSATDSTTERRVQLLEGQLAALQKDHAQLQETLRWQERLLQQSVSAPTGVSNGSQSADAPARR